MRAADGLACGAAAAAVYLGAVLAGGWSWEDYSHLRQPVSDLIARGAPTKALLDPLFLTYNGLTLACGAALVRVVRHGRAGAAETSAPAALRTTRIGQAGAWALLIEGLAGVLTLLFPEPEGGAHAVLGLAGALHVACAAATSLASILAMLLVGLWLARQPRMRAFARHALFSAGFVFVTGGVAAASLAAGWSWAGLYERLTIGGFLQWLALLWWAGRALDGRTVAPVG